MILSILGIIFNSIALFYLIAKKKKTKIVNLLIFLELSDIFVLIGILSYSILHEIFLKDQSTVYFFLSTYSFKPLATIISKFFSPYLDFSTTFNIWQNIFITIEKYLIIFHSKISKKLSNRHIFIIEFSLILLSIIMSFYQIFLYKLEYGKSIEKWIIKQSSVSKNLFFLIFSKLNKWIIQIILPIFIISFTTFTLFKKTKNFPKDQRLPKSLIIVNIFLIIVLVYIGIEDIWLNISFQNDNILDCKRNLIIYSKFKLIISTVHASINFFIIFLNRKNFKIISRNSTTSIYSLYLN